MNILVINSGSSSIKYQFFNMSTSEVIAKGLVEKIGLKGSRIKHSRKDGQVVILEGDILDHQSGIEFLLGVLVSKKHGCISKLSDIDAVGHRVVHGAEHFNTSVLITDKVVEVMESCVDLAPLHNPPNLKGIYAMRSLLPEVKQVGVFDTAFHQTMPDYAYLYGLPYTLYKKYGVRRYGFHGTSHRYVSNRACEVLNIDYNNQKIISCHLGNGASVAAINNGKSIDTSMGMTPVEGLIMGTRSGDLDLGVYNFIMHKEEINCNTTYTLLSYLGIEIDDDLNNGLRGKEAIISTKNSKVKVIIIPTNEELVIANDTVEIISKK